MKNARSVPASRPLPAVPPPPQLPADARQRIEKRAILASMKQHAAQGASLGVINMATGYPASAVDLGRLSDVVTSGLSTWSMADVRARRGEVRAWLDALVSTWVQRVKVFNVRFDDASFQVKLSTKDDRGFYDYGFEVVPGGR